MKKELLNEVNNIRIKMGLKIINESSTLITEASPILTFVEKSLINAAEKNLLKKYIKQEIMNASEETAFNAFIKGAKGKEFIKNLESAIANESDDAIKSRLQGWLKSNQRKFGISPSTKVPPKGTTTNTFNTGSIAKETEALFGQIKYTPEQIKFLNDAADKIYNGVNNLNAKEILILTEDLKKFGIQIQSVINKYEYSKNIKDAEKAKKLQSMLNTLTNYIHIIVKNSGKVPLYETIKTFVKASIGILTIAYLAGLYVKFSNTKVGKHVTDTISKVPNPFDSEESETKPENKGKGKYNDL